MQSIYKVQEVKTTPFGDQKPGTSGLRKKVDVFKQEHYLENFVQSIFDVLPVDTKGQSLVVSGDGRYYNDVAIKTIVRIAAANGVGTIIIGQEGFMSTPAVSYYIRKLNETTQQCMGGILLTASHNPGGEKGDFGIKFNAPNGGPAPESITEAIFEASKKIERIAIVPDLEDVELSSVLDKEYQIEQADKSARTFKVQVVPACDMYVQYMETLFDFDKLRAFVQQDSFSLCFDGMHGISGPYATEVLVNKLGIKHDQLMRCNVLPDFGGAHPDPNLTYAPELVEIMAIRNMEKEGVPEFGAACDGDADRNMILGKKFFVTPSDSVAIIVANYRSIKYLREQGITGAARSMPTSGALDKVIEQMQQVEETKHLQLFETPTGWKFFGNLLDQNMISICGEESFGTGSNHVREKDGLWAVLCWLAILADTQKPVETIVREHWAKYGRNYYQRYDYEGLDNEVAAKVFERIVEQMPVFSAVEGQSAEIFSYTDPVDKSVSDNQGWIFKYADGSRFIFRKSGTGSSGTTIRLYLEKYNKDELDLEVSLALKDIITTALDLCQIHEITGLKEPTVIT